MARRAITIAGIGPFIYDDSKSKAIQTDGEVDAENISLIRVLQTEGIDMALAEYDLDCENLIITIDFGH